MVEGESQLLPVAMRGSHMHIKEIEWKTWPRQWRQAPLIPARSTELVLA